MAGPSTIKAGGAYVQLFTDNNPLQQGLKAAEAKLRAFGAAIAGIGLKFAALGGAIWAPLLGAAKSFADSGSELLLMSQRTGVSVEALSQLRYAAQQSGVGADALEGGIRRMSKTIQAAADGNEHAITSLANLGISIDDLKELSPDQMFARLAKGLAAIPNPTTRAARAMEIFGKAATDLLPLLEKGSEGIEELMKKADALGLTKSLEGAQNAFKLKLALDAVKGSMSGIINAVGGAIAPLLTFVAQQALPLIAAFRQWVKDNQALWNVLLAVGGALTAVGTALILVGGAFNLASMAIAPITAIFGMILSLFGSLISLFTFLLSPIGLIVLGIAAAIGAILAFTDEGQKAVSALVTGFENVWQVFSVTWAGISDAIAAGDWAGAIEIAWEGIKLVFKMGIAEVTSMWRHFSGAILDAFIGVSDGLAMVFALIWDGFRAGINMAIDLLNNLISGANEFLSYIGVEIPLIARMGNGDTFETTRSVVDQHRSEQAERERQRNLADAADQKEIADLQKDQADRAADAAQKLIEKQESEQTGIYGPSGGAGRVSAGLDEAQGKLDVAGSFGGAGVAGLGATSLTEKMAATLDRIASNTDPRNNTQPEAT